MQVFLCLCTSVRSCWMFKLVRSCVLFRFTNQQEKQQQQPVPRAAAAVTPASTPPVVAATRGPSPRQPVPGVSSTAPGSYPRPPAPPSSSAAAVGAATAGRPAAESSVRCAVCSQALIMSNRRVCVECRRDVCHQCSTSADVRILT